MKPIMKGIDVSAHQGAINWQKVKASGIDFAIIRAGYGRGNQEGRAIQNIEGALAAGVHVGVYWFCYALTPEEAEAEAEECLRLIEPYRGRLTFPVCYDLEASGFSEPGKQGSEEYAAAQGLPYTKEMRSAIATAFLDRIERAGYYAMLYANWDYVENRYVPGSMSNYDLWLASPGTPPYRSCGIWQFSWHGTVPGVSEVDLNYSYRDYPKIIQSRGLNGFPVQDEEGEENQQPPVVVEKEFLVEIPFKTEEDRERFLSAIGRARKTDRILTPEKMRKKEK